MQSPLVQLGIEIDFSKAVPSEARTDYDRPILLRVVICLTVIVEAATDPHQARIVSLSPPSANLNH